MKNRLVTFIIAAIGLTLVACGSNEKKDKTAEVIETANTEPTTIVVDAPEEEIYESTWMANPWVDSDRAGVFEATGFDMVAPEGSANVIYSYMPSEGMAQMNYNFDNDIWVYRIKPTETLEDISGMYFEWHYTGETKIAGMDAMEYSYVSGEQEDDYIDNLDCTRVVNWFDAKNKVTYSLAVMGGNLNGMDTNVFAEDLFKLTCDLKNTPESDLYESFLGLHVSSYDGSDIMVEEDGENGRLKVNVGIFRLCTIDDGVGIFENDTVSFTAKDPNGNQIRCCLYYDSDNSLCLEVVDSAWDVLPTGTVICGFDK